MKKFGFGALALLAVPINEVGASVSKIFTNDEIMANMTVEKAARLILNSEELKERPQLMVFLESTFGADGEHEAKELRTVQRHGKDLPKEYAALDPARNMLNEMMDDSGAKLDNEVEKCGSYNRETMALLEEVRQDVASFNSQAAEARSRVLKSQATIGFANLKLPQVTEELEQHNAECTKEESSLTSQVAIVLADIEVMAGVLKMVGDCGSNAAAGLIQCRHCRKNGEGYMMMQNSTLQPLLLKLRSAAVRSYVQESLDKAYEEAVAIEPAAALSQNEVASQLAMLQGSKLAVGRSLRAHRQDPMDPELLAGMGNGSEALNISEVPKETVPYDCVPTSKCTLGKGSCVKIRDRFLGIAAGIQDMFTKLQGELMELQAGCLEDKTIMEAQIANLGEKLRVSQTELATATKDQVDSESSSNLKAQQHTEVSNEYGTTMKECCDNQNDLKSEICALEKIRGELYKQKGWAVEIADCSVSDWKQSKCSVSCGGGFLTKTRSVLVHPNNGMQCPPLSLKESCNTHPCPIDCVVGEWEGWSGCSAECGGGIRERMRPVLTEMKYSGEPCEDTEETEGCNSQNCNADCNLVDWTEWTSCSQACWKGSARRDRVIKDAARGTGKCPAPVGEERLQYRDCNDKPCSEFYHTTPKGNFIKCGSKVDLIILMDGSGSLGQTGWMSSLTMVQSLLSNLMGADDMVKAALQVFSGPTTWDQYRSCIGAVGSAPPDMEKDCRIAWIKHLTNNTIEIAKMVSDLKFPEATTLTSVALATAEAELINGREDASSVVLVITDGKPMSHERTVAAATALKEKARIIWVPVGPSAPMELVEELASLPKHENVIQIDDLKKLAWPYFVNKIIAAACPVLEPVAAPTEAPMVAPTKK
mmetsp:Transcript_145458/g.466159  ORF Transcript_145458/g.466159 Transcript_145458/m.466159 type:complete len:877 (+) Transcript_145458:72-2702(+)